jgi:hypothetical protein
MVYEHVCKEDLVSQNKIMVVMKNIDPGGF